VFVLPLDDVQKCDAPYLGVMNDNQFEHPALEEDNRTQIKWFSTEACADRPK
jgi:hypothetical protein